MAGLTMPGLVAGEAAGMTRSVVEVRRVIGRRSGMMRWGIWIRRRRRPRGRRCRWCTIRGSDAYEVLLVRRNGHGVDSGNRTVVPVIVNGSGNEGFDPVGPVTGLRAVASGMRVRVCAEYLEGTEEPPTRFSGVVELPAAADTEFEVAMDVGVDGIGKLDVTLDVVGDPGTATITVWAERVEMDATVTEGAESVVNLALPGAGLAVVRGMMVEDATGVAF